MMPRWFDRLLSPFRPSVSQEAAGAGPAAPGVIARVAASTGVVVVVHEHTLEVGATRGPAWTFVTEGRAAVGQPELMMTVLRSRRLAASGVPQALIRMLGGLAPTKQPLQPGMSVRGATTDEPLIPGTAMRAAVFVPKGGDVGVPLPQHTLTMVPMTLEEHRCAQQFGFVRWAARIGHDTRAFPTAWWCNPERAPVLAESELAQSLLGRLAVHYLVGTSVIYEPTATPPRTTVVIEPIAAEEVRAMGREAGDVLVLLAGLGGRGDSCMVWRPGQGEPAAISAPGGTGARMAGNFLMLMTQANAADEFRMFEDGFALMLRPSTWTRVVAAIAAGEPLEVPLADTVFALEWASSAHVDPTGLVFRTDGAWRNYDPEGEKGGGDTQVVLLIPEDLLPRRIGIEPLAAYIKRLEAAVHAHEPTAGPRPGHRLAVDVTLTPDASPAIELRSDHAAELGGHLTSLGEHLRGLAGPRPTGEVHFLLEMKLPAVGGG